MTGEQAALCGRVATLVARAAPPEGAFAAVTEETGRLVGADQDGDGQVRPGRCAENGGCLLEQHRRCLPDRRQPGRARRAERGDAGIRRDGRAARINDYAGAWGLAADAVREFWFQQAAGRRAGQRPRTAVGVMIVDSRVGLLLYGDRQAPAGGVHRNWPRPRLPTPRPGADRAGSPRSRPRCGGWRRWWHQAAPPPEVLNAVTEEAGLLLHADYADNEPLRLRRHGEGGQFVEQHRPGPPGARSKSSAGGTSRQRSFQTHQLAISDRQLRRRLRPDC